MCFPAWTKQLKTIPFWKKFQTKFICLDLWKKVLIVQKSKLSTYCNLSQNSNSQFSVTTSFISSWINTFAKSIFGEKIELGLRWSWPLQALAANMNNPTCVTFNCPRQSSNLTFSKNTCLCSSMKKTSNPYTCLKFFSVTFPSLSSVRQTVDCPTEAKFLCSLVTILWNPYCVINSRSNSASEAPNKKPTISETDSFEKLLFFSAIDIA